MPPPVAARPLSSSTTYDVCPRCAQVVDGDVRQVTAPAEDLVDLLDASWKRGFDDLQVEFFRASMRVVWARAYRAGRNAR